ncbi:ABC transporter substrate-binding protein [Parasphingorhabdus sp.]|jgi:NitT/TauT family transport system ATP-binding protein|uniref:ABC transporter substrate-binding protein n=1 Tax=Parasphingorhabdus sp. TaxID=2709688 RepID=UPI003D2A3CD2
MTKDLLSVGFLPLVDSALPILAQELGIAEEHGLDLRFIKDMSWAAVNDRLLYGQTDVAHMLAPLTIANTLGRGRPAKAMAVPFVLGLNGNALTMSNELADEIEPDGKLAAPIDAGARLTKVISSHKKTGRRLKFGVVHRYSSHNYMLRYWLAGCGIDPDKDIDIVTISPPFAADALDNGEIDAICVGEPWNSVAVERGSGRIVLVTAQIWQRGVEKVLAMLAENLDEKRDIVERLIRALHETAARFVEPENWETNSAILARPEYLDGSVEMIRRAISDRILLSKNSETSHIPDFMFQYHEAANFPWKSQASWLYSQMLRWDDMTYSHEDQLKVEAIFRSNVYRCALDGIDTPMPSANSKIEGGIEGPLAVGTTQGQLTLSSDPFFDDRIFDPDKLPEYLTNLP